MSVQVPKGYKQTEVGVIPEDWHQSTVGAEFEIKNNLRLPLSSSVRKSMAGDFPYYGPTGVQGYINEFRVEGEFALIGEDGDHFLKWNERPMTQMVRGKFNVNNHAHIVLGVKNETQWFYYYFYNRDITSFLTRQGANRYKLTKKTLLDLPCAIPESKKEQQAIAEALSDADALIESLEQLIAKKRQIKQGAMQELLTGQRRLPGFSGEWVRRSLDEVADVIDPHPSHRAPNEVPNGIPFLGIGDFDENGNIVGKKLRFVDPSVLEEHAGRYCLDDALIGLGRVASIGKVVSLKKHDDGYAISPTLGVIRGRDVGRDFLIYSLKSSFVKDQFLKIMSGSTRSSVGMQVLRELIIELPPSKEEQNSIATCLKDMDYEIEILDMRLDKARQIKQSMMQELLTGRIRLI